MILREKRSRKYRIKIFRLRLCSRENRLWIFARYACTLSRLVITDLTVDRCLDGYYCSLSLFCRNGKLGIHNEIIWSYHKVYYYKNCWKCCLLCRKHTFALLIKFLWALSNVFDCFKVWKATVKFVFVKIVITYSIVIKCTRTERKFKVDFLENEASNEKCLFYIFDFFFRVESPIFRLYYQLPTSLYDKILF